MNKEQYENFVFNADQLGKSGYPELETNLIVLMSEQFNLFCKKQRDYGPGNINAFGEFGILVRLNDKVERLKNLLNKPQVGQLDKVVAMNESIDDTWMDIATYALIALLVRRDQWPK